MHRNLSGRTAAVERSDPRPRRWPSLWSIPDWRTRRTTDLITAAFPKPRANHLNLNPKHTQACGHVRPELKDCQRRLRISRLVKLCSGGQVQLAAIRPGRLPCRRHHERQDVPALDSRRLRWGMSGGELDMATLQVVARARPKSDGRARSPTKPADLGLTKLGLQ